MKLLFLLLSIASFQVHSQKLYLTPFGGIKADIGSTKSIPYEDYVYFKTTSPRVHFDLSPVLLGLNLEYKWKKNAVGFSIVTGDIANSTIQLEYFVKSDEPYWDYKRKTQKSNYAGVNVFKIPLSYKREIYRKYSSKNANKPLFSLSLNTGINLMFIKVKGVSPYTVPISFGKEVTLLNDTIELVGYEGHWNRPFSVSFNLGLDADFYLKNKRFLNLQLYYEQGTKYISHSTFFVYKNDQFWFDSNSLSRGSSIQLKLGFPINIAGRKNDI